jgi:Tfp pilus assembly protein PilO
MNQIPIFWLLLSFLGYLGYNYYSFSYDPESDLNKKIEFLKKTKDSAILKEKNIKKLESFKENLLDKKKQLLALSDELKSLKNDLSENDDTPSTLHSILTQAKRVGLLVVSLHPTLNQKKDFYTQQNYEIELQGIFVQIIGFFEQIAQSKTILTVDEIILNNNSMKEGPPQLEAKIELKTYRYLPTPIDNLSYVADDLNFLLKRIKEKKTEPTKKTADQKAGQE